MLKRFMAIVLSMMVLPAMAASEAPQAEKVHHLVWQMFDRGADEALVWVFFTDKDFEDAGAVEEALLRLERTYGERAIRRRSMRRTLAGLVDERDLPVAAEYVQCIEGAANEVRVQSRWLNAVSARATREQIEAIEALPFVRGIQLVRRGSKPELRIDGVHGSFLGGGFYGPAEPQLAQITVTDLHAAGFTGEGVVIGVLDTGFKRTHDVFNDVGHPLEVVAEYDFIDDDANTAPEAGDPPQQHEHGTIILGTMAGYQPGVYVGGAFDASYILAKTEDTTAEYPAEEDFYVAGLEFIEQNGGDVATSSLIYRDWYTQQDMDGQTAVTTIAVNIATANGLFCCTAAGNSGHDQDPETSHLGAPGDAFEVITVGAVNIFGEPPGFSSDGPTADGRVKPEVLSCGEAAWSIHPDDDDGLIEASGTSMATPLIAGAVACLVEAAPHWTVSRMRDALFTTASVYVDTGTHDPFFVMGYGIANAFSALDAGGPSNATLTGFRFDQGSLVSGGLDDLAAVDDSAVRGRSAPGFSIQEANVLDLFIFAEGDVVDPVHVDMAVRSRLNHPGGTARFRLMRHSTGRFEDVASFQTATTYRLDEVADIDATPYVEEGSGRVTLSIRTVVVATFSAQGFDGFYDFVRISLD